MMSVARAARCASARVLHRHSIAPMHSARAHQELNNPDSNRELRVDDHLIVEAEHPGTAHPARGYGLLTYKTAAI